MAEYEAQEVVYQPESLSVDLINDREEERSNGIVDQVFGNSLIVELMCSYVSSVADLRNLRLVNHTFQIEATKKLRKVHKEIVLNTESCVRTLVDCAKSRDALNLTPFPFASFRVFIDYSSLETLENFGKLVGPHITRYRFQLRSRFSAEHSGNTTKVVTLLSHSTELVALEILSNLALILTPEDLDRFPSAFPHLSTLEITGTHANTQPEGETVILFSLVDLFIIRAPQLQKVNISEPNPSQITRILRSLDQNRQNLPSFSLVAHPYFSPFIDEVMNMDFNLTKLTIPMFVLNSEQAQRMIRRLCTWLKTQTNNLINLSIDIFSYREQVEGSFRFPQLQVLRNLQLTFPDERTFFAMPYSRHIQPFVGNPFPSLRKLCLERYREEFTLFGPRCSMPSVQELHLYNQRCSLSDPSWSKRFPNLTTLHIELDRKMPEVFRSLLSYILTHLTRLEHLDLDIVGGDRYHWFEEPNSSWSSWDILTGGARESFRELNWSDQKFLDNVGATEEPVNGIYRVPSLSNMKNLKTLRIFPRLKSNLDAIIYMSRKGLLGPLQKLVLSSLPDDRGPRLTEGEKTSYKEVLLSVHKEVVLWK